MVPVPVSPPPVDLDGVLQCLNQNGTRLHSFGVARIGVFGSFARGEAREASDLDILVEFAPDALGFDSYMNLKFFLEEIFGRSVDLVLASGLKPALRERILSEVVYAA